MRLPIRYRDCGLALLLALIPAALQAAAPERITLEVVSVRPHDTQAFTQGLLQYQGSLYESTGVYGSSSLRKVDPLTGSVLRRVNNASSEFAEGLARVNDRLIQLTWKENVAHVYELSNFNEVDQFAYVGEGWGLCYDGNRLVMSDGTSQLQFRNPTTFALLGTVVVTIDGTPQPRINELECVGTDVYANVWQTDAILRIDATTGEVGAIIDASGLLTSAEAASADMLNGIAFDAATGLFLITGKNWPKLFEVRFGAAIPTDDGGQAGPDGGSSDGSGDSGGGLSGDTRQPVPPPTGCGCGAASATVLPALILLGRRRPAMRHGGQNQAAYSRSI
ncbi:MAG: glutaminyl-peptide cyclotransferase [Myxococcota bacterium]